VITAAGNIRALPGTRLEANTDRFLLISLGGANLADLGSGTFRSREILQLTDFDILNRKGDVEVFGPRMVLTDFTMTGGRGATLSAEASLALLSSQPISNFSFPTEPIPTTNKVAGAAVSRLTAGGDLNAQGLFVSGRQIEVRGGGINLRAVQLETPTTSTTGTISITARDNLEVSLAYLRAPTVNLSAHTLILRNVDFQSGSSVTMKSALGALAPNPNSSRSVRPGFVNFVTNVLYGGSDASEAITTSSSGPGIRIQKR
jgi:hypothetical protein